MKSIENQIDNILQAGQSAIADVQNEDALQTWRSRYTGRSSELAGILKNLKDVPKENRKKIGQKINAVKQELERLLESKSSELVGASLDDSNGAQVDISVPGTYRKNGHLHPITLALRETLNVLSRLGFSTVEGPEAESSYYNFDRLRIPEDHPARDMWDTFWLQADKSKDPLLLRTHTSPMQIRFLEDNDPPIRIAVPGKCYRYEATDATHEWMMHQVEILAIDKGISISNLKGTLQSFAYEMFGLDAKIMLRNSYFPFVEPGVEMAVFFKGEWLEIMGAGMVHPDIIDAAGYDPNVYTGFAGH